LKPGCIGKAVILANFYIKFPLMFTFTPFRVTAFNRVGLIYMLHACSTHINFDVCQPRNPEISGQPARNLPLKKNPVPGKAVSDVRIDLKFQAQSKKSMLTIKPALVIG
jgi:hypothetical protein